MEERLITLIKVMISILLYLDDVMLISMHDGDIKCNLMLIKGRT